MLLAAASTRRERVSKSTATLRNRKRFHYPLSTATADSMTMTTATPILADFTLEYDAWGQLVLTCADGRRFVGVEPVRAFPISGRKAYCRFATPRGTN